MENLDETPISDLTDKPITKTELGIKPEFKPVAPDFVCKEQPNVCAWVDKRNQNGDIILMNLKVGTLRFKLQKRFL